MQTTNQQFLDELAKQAEEILQKGSVEADNLLVKTATLRSQLDRLKHELTDEIARQSKTGELM